MSSLGRVWAITLVVLGHDMCNRMLHDRFLCLVRQ